MDGFLIRRPHCIPLLITLFSMPACRATAGAAGAIVLVDDAGDTTALRSPARRVASLIPATTEVLFAIGAGPAVVGRTHWCDYPPAAAQVTDLGDGIGPNIEAILQVHPDLVLLYRSGRNAAAAAQLRGLGIPTLQLRTDDFGDFTRVTKTLARATGTDTSASLMLRRYGQALASASVTPQPKPRSVFILVWDQPPMTLGRGSFLSEIVDRAGAHNVFADLAASSASVSIEAVARRDPDVILVASEGTPAFAERAEWQVVRAVRDKRFVRVSGSEFNRPSPRAPEAVRKLRAALAAVLP